MAEAAKANISKKEQKAKEKQQRELLQALEDAAEQLKMARHSFENITDPDLIEACVFEINSLQARYSYLINLAKREGLEGYRIFRDRKEQ